MFPLKGKLLNVRGASRRQIANNEELRQVASILGLSLVPGQQRIDPAALRYGRLMIMADQVLRPCRTGSILERPLISNGRVAGDVCTFQDHDGSHIKGLIINLLHHIWPGLLQMDGFLIEFTHRQGAANDDGTMSCGLCESIAPVVMDLRIRLRQACW